MARGVGQPSTKELLLSRYRECSSPAKRKDPYHLALVIEGGGMRGVVAGGMVTAIQEMNLTDCFDSIHASSAGACAGAYLLADQAAFGTSIYYEDINNDKFISIANIFRGKPIMDVNFLIDYVMRDVKTLDVEKIIDDGRLHIVATDANSAKAESFSNFKDKDDFFIKLKASISIPVIAGNYIEINGARYFDGGLAEHIAINSALKHGATHILVLFTTKMNNLFRNKKGGVLRKIEEKILISRYNKNILDAYICRDELISKTVQDILLDDIGYSDSRICTDFIVRKIDSTYISRLDKEKDRLLLGAKEGRLCVKDYFGDIS